MISNGERDLLAWVLRYGEVAASVLRETAERVGKTRVNGVVPDVSELLSAASDLSWLVQVNRQTWTHTVHTDSCMSDAGEHDRARMTPDTVAANHRLHMADVERLDAVRRRP